MINYYQDLANIGQRGQEENAKRSAANFNIGNALLPAIVAAIAAPFTGGASLAGVASAFGTGALKGSIMEGARSLTANQDPIAQQLAMGAAQEGTKQAFPSADIVKTKEAFANMLTKGKFTPEQQAVFKLAENSPDLQKELFSKWAGSQFDKPVSPEVTATKLLSYIEPVPAFDNETMIDKEGAKVFEYSSPLLPGIKYWRMKKNVSPYAFFGGNQ